MVSTVTLFVTVEGFFFYVTVFNSRFNWHAQLRFDEWTNMEKDNSNIHSSFDTPATQYIRNSLICLRKSEGERTQRVA